MESVISVASPGTVGSASLPEKAGNSHHKMPECIRNIFQAIARLFARLIPSRKRETPPIPTIIPPAEVKAQRSEEEIAKNKALLQSLNAYKALQAKTPIIDAELVDLESNTLQFMVGIFFGERTEVVTAREKKDKNNLCIEAAQKAICDLQANFDFSQIDVEIHRLEQFMLEVTPPNPAVVDLPEIIDTRLEFAKFLTTLTDKNLGMAVAIFNSLLKHHGDDIVSKFTIDGSRYTLELKNEIVVFIKDAEDTVEGALVRFGPKIVGELGGDKITFAEGVKVQAKVTIGYGWVSRNLFVEPTVKDYSFNQERHMVRITAYGQLAGIGKSDTKERGVAQMCDDFSRSEIAGQNNTYDEMVRRSLVSTE